MGLFARRMLRFLGTHQKLKFLLGPCNNAEITVSSGRFHGTLCFPSKRVDSNLKKLNSPLEHPDRTVQCFHSSSFLSALPPAQFENAFAHRVFDDSQTYSLTLAAPLVVAEETPLAEVQSMYTMNWADAAASDVVAAFKKLICYSSKSGDELSDSKYTNFMTALTKKCSTLNDSELEEVLCHLHSWSAATNLKNQNYQLVWAALDKECVSRIPGWSIEKLLLTCDHWYKLRLARIAQFPWHALRKLGRNPRKLSAANLVQCMFVINICRSNPVHMYDMEHRLESCIEELTMDEVAIVAMGFFKSQTPIRNSQLLITMMRMIIINSEKVHEISLAALLKVLRYSIRTDEAGLLRQLMRHLTPEVPRLSLQCLVHIALSGSGIQLYDKDLLDAITKRFAREISSARLKDIERMAYVMTLFGIENENHHPLLDIFINDVRHSRRNEEKERYTRSLSCFLHFLTLANVYPQDQIALILDPKALKVRFGNSAYKMGHEILSLDVGLEIEVPTYSGPKLTEKFRTTLAKRHANWAPSADRKAKSHTDKLHLDVLLCCEDLLGSSTMVVSDHVLPNHQRSDIIFCLDEYDSPVPIHSVLSGIPFGYVKYKPEIFLDGPKWYALVIAGRNSFIRETTEFVGILRTKLRQLKKIGYIPIVIPFYEWENMGIKEEKLKYLKRKLFS